MSLDTKGAKRFEYAYSLSGSDKAMYRRCRIAAATVIERGEVVTRAEGLVVAVSVDTDPILGVSKDPHDGSSDGQKGLFIDVYISPDAVFRTIPEELGTCESGSGSVTIVDATYSGADFADDVFNGGYIKAVNVVAVADAEVIRITDFVAATGTFTLASGTFATADTFLLFPPEGCTLITIDSDGIKLDMTDLSASIFTVVEVDPDKDESVMVTPNEHLLAADLV